MWVQWVGVMWVQWVRPTAGAVGGLLRVQWVMSIAGEVGIGALMGPDRFRAAQRGLSGQKWPRYGQRDPRDES